MGYDEKDEDPHEPEMPNARRIEPTKHRSQRMELHGLVNRPARSYRKETGERNGEVRCALERVVLCVDTGMRPLAARKFGQRKSYVVPQHPEGVTQIGP